ncbi:MAG: preprotein translocase subunit SecG [Candidatus Omnitrophota bacterium]
MIIFLLVLYVIVCILLITLILLQPSEGGGLSQSLGGGQVQTILGTKTTSFLVKITAVLATIFLIICLLLAVASSRKGKSLMETPAAVEMQNTAPIVETGAETGDEAVEQVAQTEQSAESQTAPEEPLPETTP